MNEQARLLELGSGGFDVLYANLTRGLGLARRGRGARDGAAVHAGAGRGPARGGGRRAAGVARRDAGRAAARSTARSRRCAPALAGTAGRVRPGRPAARCPSRSRTPCALLKERGLLEVALAVAPCLDGDVDCVTRRLRARLGARGGLRRGRLLGRAGHRRHGHVARPRRARARRTPPTSRRALGGRPDAGRPGRPRPTRASATAASRTTREAVLELCAWPRSRRRLGREEVATDGWEDGVRRPAALAHGPRRRRGSGLLPRRVRRRRVAARARRLMEERRLGPVVGLGTWNTFKGDDAARARGRRQRARRGRPLLRLLADVRRCRAVARRRRSTAAATKRPC